MVAHDHDVFLRVENSVLSCELVAPLLKLREWQVDKPCEHGREETSKKHALVRERGMEGA